MPRLRSLSLALLLAGVAASPALTQGVAQGWCAADQLGPGYRANTPPEQLSGSGPANPPDLAFPEQIGPLGADPLYIAGPPAGTSDSCEAFLAKRGPAPKGVDCLALEAQVRKPDPLAPTSVPGSGLTAAPGQRDYNVLPDAQDVARRLATGDFTASAVAQAVGSGFGAPPTLDSAAKPAAPAARGTAPTVAPGNVP